MVIPKEILEKWKTLRSKEDVAEIWKQHRINTNTIYKALKTGECSYSVFEKIASFYAEREKKISSISTAKNSFA